MRLKRLKDNQSFTLLEIIIVIIIVGVLASLALPRFFSLIESSRQTEALVNITSIRQALERVYIMKKTSGDTRILAVGPNDDWNQLAIDNPNLSPNAHFLYMTEIFPDNGTILVMALRNCRDNGHTGIGPHVNTDTNFIFLQVNNVMNATMLCGFGYYKGLNMEGDTSACENSWLGWEGDGLVYQFMSHNYSACPG